MPLRSYISDDKFQNTVSIYEPVFNNNNSEIKLAIRKPLICYKKVSDSWEFHAFMISDSDGILWVCDLPGANIGVYGSNIIRKDNGFGSMLSAMKNCAEGREFNELNNLKIVKDFEEQSGQIFSPRFEKGEEYLFTHFPYNFFEKGSANLTEFNEHTEENEWYSNFLDYAQHLTDTVLDKPAKAEWVENAIVNEEVDWVKIPDDNSFFSKSATRVSVGKSHTKVLIVPTLPMWLSRLTMHLRAINREGRQFAKIKGFNDQTVSLMAMAREIFKNMAHYGADDNSRIDPKTKDKAYRIIDSVFDDMILDVLTQAPDLNLKGGKTYAEIEDEHTKVLAGLCDSMQRLLENRGISKAIHAVSLLAQTHNSADELEKRIPFLDLCRKGIASNIISESFMTLSLHPQNKKAAEFYKHAIFPLIVRQSCKLEDEYINDLKAVVNSKTLRSVFPFVSVSDLRENENEFNRSIDAKLDDGLIKNLNKNLNMAVTKSSIESAEPQEDEYAGLSLFKTFYIESPLKDIWVNQWGTPSTLSCILQTYSAITLNLEKKPELFRRAFEIKNALFLFVNTLSKKTVLPVKLGEITPAESYLSKIRMWLEKRYDKDGTKTYDAPDVMNHLLSSIGLVNSLIMTAGLIRKIENDRATGDPKDRTWEYIRDSFAITCQFGTAISGILSCSKTLAKSINYKILESTFLTVTGPINGMNALRKVFSRTCDYFQKGESEIFMLTAYRLQLQGYLTLVSSYKALNTINVYTALLKKRVRSKAFMELAEARAKRQLIKEGAEEVTEALVKKTANRMIKKIAVKITAKHTAASWTNAVPHVLVAMLILDVIDILYGLYKSWKLKSDLENYPTFKFLFSLSSTIDSRLREGDIIPYHGIYYHIPKLIWKKEGEKEETSLVEAKVEDMHIGWKRMNQFLSADGVLFPRFLTLFGEDKIQNVVQNLKQGNIDGKEAALALNKTGLFTDDMIVDLTGIDPKRLPEIYEIDSIKNRSTITGHLGEQKEFHKDNNQMVVMKFLDEHSFVEGVITNNTLNLGSISNFDYGSSLNIKTNSVMTLKTASKIPKNVHLWFSEGEIFTSESAAKCEYPPQKWYSNTSGGFALLPTELWDKIDSENDIAEMWNYPGNNLFKNEVTGYSCTAFEDSLKISLGDVFISCVFTEPAEGEESDDDYIRSNVKKHYQMFRVVTIDPERDGFTTLEWRINKKTGSQLS